MYGAGFCLGVGVREGKHGKINDIFCVASTVWTLSIYVSLLFFFFKATAVN